MRDQPVKGLLLRVSDWYEWLVIPSQEILHVVVDTMACVPQLLLYISGCGWKSQCCIDHVRTPYWTMIHLQQKVTQSVRRLSRQRNSERQDRCRRYTKEGSSAVLNIYTSRSLNPRIFCPLPLQIRIHQRPCSFLSIPPIHHFQPRRTIGASFKLHAKHLQRHKIRSQQEIAWEVRWPHRPLYMIPRYDQTFLVKYIPALTDMVRYSRPPNLIGLHHPSSCPWEFPHLNLVCLRPQNTNGKFLFPGLQVGIGKFLTSTAG